MPATAAPKGRPSESATRRRTAKIRARCAGASPRISYRTLAESAGLAHGTVKIVLSDNSNWNVSDILDRVEAALDSVEAATS
jgi:hypothetical protein